jgi:hypothetical protein
MNSSLSPGNNPREQAFQQNIKRMRLFVRITNLVIVFLVLCLIAIILFVIWVTVGLAQLIHK